MISVDTFVSLIFMGLLRGALYALVAASLSLVFGVLNIVSFMQGDLAMIGAYICFWLIYLLDLNPLIAIAISAASLFFLGYLIEKGFIYPLRRRGRYAEWVLNSFVLTLGLSIVFQNTALSLWGGYYRGFPYLWPGTVSFLGFSFSIERLIILSVSTAAILTFWIFLTRTKMGRAIRAVSIDEEASVMVGVNIDRIYSISMGLGAILSAVAGTLLLPIFSVYPTFGIAPSLKAWTVVIMAGLGNIKGAIVCSILLGLIEAFAFFFTTAGWQSVVSLVIVILVLLFKPSGIFGEKVKGIWER